VTPVNEPGLRLHKGREKQQQGWNEQQPFEHAISSPDLKPKINPFGVLRRESS
jgi:hypothetical protein